MIKMIFLLRVVYNPRVCYGAYSTLKFLPYLAQFNFGPFCFLLRPYPVRFTHIHVYTFDRNKETSEFKTLFISKSTIPSKFRFETINVFRFSEWHTIQIGQMNQIIIKYWD